MSNLYRGPSIDVSYQVSDQLALRFQRRLKCERLTDDRRRTPSNGKSSHCLWQGEIKNSANQKQELTMVATNIIPAKLGSNLNS